MSFILKYKHYCLITFYDKDLITSYVFVVNYSFYLRDVLLVCMAHVFEY